MDDGQDAKSLHRSVSLAALVSSATFSELGRPGEGCTVACLEPGGMAATCTLQLARVAL